MKIAVRSKKNFDFPFYELDKQAGNKGINFGIYFENYKMNDDKFVIPYYFPSGSLYESKDNLNDYIDSSILLSDFDNPKKIKKCLAKMEYPYNARFISDLFSFMHFLLYPINNNEGQSEYRTKTNELIASHFGKKKLYESWRYYGKPVKIFKDRILNWSESIFIEESILPSKLTFYIYPYLDLEDEREEIQKKYYDFTSDLIKLIVSITNFPKQ